MQHRPIISVMAVRMTLTMVSFFLVRMEVPPLLVCPLFLAAPLDQRNDHDDGKHDQCLCRCVACFILDKSGIDDIDAHDGGGLTGAAIGQGLDDGKVLQAGDDGTDGQKEGGGRDCRNHNVLDLLPLVCTIDLGGFYLRFVHVLQCTQIGQKVQTDALPHGDQYNGRQCPFLVEQWQKGILRAEKLLQQIYLLNKSRYTILK